MLAIPPASSRYAVRFGKLTFTERLIEAFATMGDLHGTAVAVAVDADLLSDAIEIIDRHNGHVVRRIRDTIDRIAALHDNVTLALERLDISTFERQWLGPPAHKHATNGHR